MVAMHIRNRRKEQRDTVEPCVGDRYSGNKNERLVGGTVGAPSSGGLSGTSRARAPPT